MGQLPDVEYEPAAMSPDVSVLVLCYQQSRFVPEALASVFAQSVDFALEIVFADDGSDDESVDVARDVAQAEGGTLRVVEDRAHVGLAHNLRRGIFDCHGRFIAVLEADDYWLSPWKLRRQYAFLEAHPDHAMCANRLLVVGSNGETSYELGAPEGVTLDARRLARSNFIANFSACMYRAQVLRQLPADLFDMFIADWAFNIAVAERGDIGYLHEALSAYRLHADSYWSSRPVGERQAIMAELVPLYDRYFGGRYEAEFGAFFAEQFPG